MINKLFFVVVFLYLNISSAVAETVWCQKFNVGCKTEEEKQTIISQCKQIAVNKYYEELANAIADPTIWQVAGNTSANDYAFKTARILKNMCIKNRM
jgi:hypothetical protein